MKLLPGCCGDLRTVIKIQLFQQHRLAQGLQKICGSICSFRVFIEAPAMFCQNQPVENTLGLRQVQVYNSSKTHPGQLQLVRQLHRSIQIWTRTTSNNRDKKTLKKKRKPSSISLCEALCEICLLQVQPLGTMQFLPRCCGDPRTEAKIQDFNGRRAQTCH